MPLTRGLDRGHGYQGSCLSHRRLHNTQRRLINAKLQENMKNVQLSHQYPDYIFKKFSYEFNINLLTSCYIYIYILKISRRWLIHPRKCKITERERKVDDLSIGSVKRYANRVALVFRQRGEPLFFWKSCGDQRARGFCDFETFLRKEGSDICLT